MNEDSPSEGVAFLEVFFFLKPESDAKPPSAAAKSRSSCNTLASAHKPYLLVIPMSGNRDFNIIYKTNTKKDSLVFTKACLILTHTNLYLYWAFFL